MPERKTIRRARKDRAQGKAPSTQAGEFVREEFDHIREGQHGARSTKPGDRDRALKGAARGREARRAEEGHDERGDARAGEARRRPRREAGRREAQGVAEAIARELRGAEARGPEGRLAAGDLSAGADGGRASSAEPEDDGHRTKRAAKRTPCVRRRRSDQGIPRANHVGMAQSCSRRTFMTMVGGACAVAACNPGGGAPEGPQPGAPREGDVALPKGGAMPFRRLGKTGVNVSIVGLGGFHLGVPKDEKETARLIHAGLDHGVTFLDNCWDYHDGKRRGANGQGARGRPPPRRSS